jgi:hypothetical protein
MADLTPDELLADAIINHTLNLFRLSASQVAEIFKRLKAMEAQLIKELAVPLISDSSKSEINAILKGSNDIIESYYNSISDDFDVPVLGDAVANVTASALEISLGVEAASVPTQAYFDAMAGNILIGSSPTSGGSSMAAYWQAQSDAMKFKYSAQVRQGLANAETNGQIIARIAGKRGVPGIMDIARRDAASLVQTSVQAVANAARLATFQKNSDVLLGVEQISTLDSHTSLICIAYSGGKWNLDGEPIEGTTLPFLGGPPRHFNCRSVLVGISRNPAFRNAPSTRASDEGQISSKTTFDDFLKRKNAAYVDEMLGAGRAQLWRDGKITLKDLVSGQGRPLTLAELQSKFAP